ncbi:MAG TPA: DsrE family protein [Chitinophagaceae bacterium]|nr:DsrE family protein [Chitinophagaceae bacterium]
MKRFLFVFLVTWLAATENNAQVKDYKVVFDVTSKDTNVHKAVIRWCNEITSAYPDAQLEVVYYGQSLDMITLGKSVVPNEVTRLINDKKVAFRVCATSLKRWKIQESQLLPGVAAVPDGIYEILQKQREGYGYIKAGL